MMSGFSLVIGVSMGLARPLLCRQYGERLS